MKHQTGIYPFWMWNGCMNYEELSRQIKLAKAGGMTGLTVHGRVGNEVPYLSKQWMDLMRFVCEEAEKAGLEIFLYDEYGFPSGDAGGKIPSLGEKFQQKTLLFSEISAAKAKELPDVIRVFSKKKPAKLLDLANTADNEIVICFRELLFERSPNMLEKETVKEFLKITHDKYYSALKSFFDKKVITGIFTDDSHYLFSPGPMFAYMDDLEDSFYDKYNYSILDNLSSLVENIPGAEKVRRDYYSFMAEAFNLRFMEPMHQWCKEHDVALYGHLSGDEGPLHKIITRFGDPGNYMKHFQIPGFDDYLLLNFDHTQLISPVNKLPAGGKLNRTNGFPVIVCTKQATSAASQTGDGRCMAEVLASSGWGVPLEMLMNHLRFLNVLGVNIFVTHDFAYTSAKVAKRDHPASYFFQQPYYERNKEIFASVSKSLEWAGRGTCYCQTLVIHPVHSAQTQIDGATLDEPGHYRCNKPSEYPDCQKVTEMLSNLCLQLTRKHISFEFGYESTLDISTIKQNNFCVGNGKYSTVILPNLVSISGKLLQLLNEFAQNGGQIIYIGNKPVMVDGNKVEEDLLPEGLLLLDINNDTVFPIEADLTFTVENGDESCVTVAKRIVDNKFEYMLHNISNKEDCQISLNLPGYLCVDPVSNAVFPIPEKFGIVHLIPNDVVKINGKMPSIFTTKNAEIIKWQSPWKIKASQKNVYRWESAEPFYSRPADFRHAEFDYAPLYLPFSNRFQLDFQIESLQIGLEIALFDSVKVNGIEILDRPKVVHPASPDLYCIEISDLVNVGENIYSFTRKEKHPEFIYLLGDFTVDESGDIPRLLVPREITFGNLALQGMPFYWGCVEYTSTFDGTNLLQASNCRIEIPAPLNGAVGVEINGVNLPMRPCAPWRYDIDEYIKSGQNTVTLIYYGTAQNFLGPRKVAQQKEHFTGWYPARSGELYDMDFGIPQVPIIAVL